MTLRSPLPSVFHRFDRVCQRPCHRPCHRVTSPIRSAFFDPPTPLGAIEALAAASVAASASVAWKGRAKAARCRHVCRNAEFSADRRCIIRSPGGSYHRYVGYVLVGHQLRRQTSGQALPMRFPSSKDTSRFVGKALIALLKRDRRPICPNHVALAEGFSRALSHELKHSWKQTRARWSRPLDCQILMVWLNGIQDRGGWGEIPRACPGFMSSLSFAAPSKKIGGQLSQTSLSIV